MSPGQGALRWFLAVPAWRPLAGGRRAQQQAQGRCRALVVLPCFSPHRVGVLLQRPKGLSRCPSNVLFSSCRSSLTTSFPSHLPHVLDQTIAGNHLTRKETEKTLWELIASFLRWLSTQQPISLRS